MIEEGQEAELLALDSAHPGKRIGSSREAFELLRSREDLSFYFFDGVEISNAVARQSLFNGVLFRGCKITDCDFSRSDFEGARFEDCGLTNVSFETCDIRSTRFSKTQIEKCTLRSSLFTDNILQDCKILDCDFEDSSVFHCIFKSTVIEGIKNRTSTWFHITFDDAVLKSTAFSDCTSSYVIYKDCVFEDIRLNADALGLTFGLSREDLDNISFAFLGQEYYAGSSPAVEDFLTQYRARGWNFHAILLALNFGEGPKQKLLFSLMQLLHQQIVEKSGAKRDDFEFVFRVMSLLHEQGKLPFSAAIFAHDLFASMPDDLREDPREWDLAQLAMQNSLLLASEMKNELRRGLAPLLELEEDASIKAKVIYEQRQAVGTIDFMAHVRGLLPGDGKPAKLLDARKGSWVEVVQATVGGLVAMYMALYLVNGCLVQITMIRARTKKLFSKRLPLKFIQAANEPTHELPQNYLKIMQKLYESQSSGDERLLQSLDGIVGGDVMGITVETLARDA